MLGRLEMSTTEALDVYDAFSKQVFSSKNKVFLPAVMWKGNRYKAIGLKQTIEELVKQRQSGDTMLNPVEQEKGRTFVCARASHAKNGKYRRFRSYPTDDDGWAKVKTIDRADTLPRITCLTGG